MDAYDIFNGDADGLCALRQLRLDEPRHAQLVTGTKREIDLVKRVTVRPGDRLTVLDVSLDVNRDALLRALAAGATCLYFDHHFPGPGIEHPALEAHIRAEPGVCTSLLVSEYLQGRYATWAVAAAFGDNVPDAAAALAARLRLPAGEVQLLRTLGECLNYNAYGESIDDLYFPPAELYRRLARYTDPLEFARHDGALDVLLSGLSRDMEQTGAIEPILTRPQCWAAILPDAGWARRVIGAWANRLAAAHPRRGHAILLHKVNHYVVSVRAPLANPVGADSLCRRFPSGGGRPAAAGINALPHSELAAFLQALEGAFVPSGS